MTTTRPTTVTIDLDALRPVFGLGVAGNFAGHLEQAGEAVDFANVTAAASMPKGIFPWYVPEGSTFLGAFPLSSGALAIPSTGDPEPRIQVEPELGLLCDVVRDDSGAVVGLTPRWMAAFDDCSLRRPGARRISEKKHWGPCSKGIATTAFAAGSRGIDDVAATLRLACFLRRGDETTPYGVDSAVPTYSLFGEALLDWLVDRIRHQRGSDDTPLEDVGALLDGSGAASVLVGVGATRYEPYGESTFVRAGDEAIVVLYDSQAHAPAEVADHVAERRDAELTHASVLRRTATVLDD